jgi:hypothetical protein
MNYTETGSEHNIYSVILAAIYVYVFSLHHSETEKSECLFWY